MLKNRALFLLVVIIMIIQAVLLNHFDTLYSSLPFLDGVPITSSYALENKFLVYWFLPIVAMSFYFTGYCSDVLKTYGKVIIIRNYGRTRWLFNRFVSMMIVTLIFVVIQVLIFRFLLTDSTINLEGIEVIKLLAMYFLTLSALFALQLVMELFISPQVAQMVVNVYIVVSLLLTKQIYLIGGGFIYYLFLPNYAMGFRNGLTSISEFQTPIISYPIGITVLMIIIASIVGFSISRIKKIDIF
ncbi:DUF2705 family protein [Fictibacillus sp. UD]|uniref:DUF2705 family protein n=1 Tax=Fictibacillus sp. UD TaxID=3038777 RepID=UPI003746591D